MLRGISILDLLPMLMGIVACFGLIIGIAMLPVEDKQEIGEAVKEIYAQVEKKGGSNLDIAFEGDIYLSRGRKWRFLVNYDDAHGLRQTYYVSLFVDDQARPISSLKWLVQA